jgi:hypothetical protein
LSRVRKAPLSRARAAALSRVRVAALIRDRTAALSRFRPDALSRVRPTALIRVGPAALSRVRPVALSRIRTAALSSFMTASLSSVKDSCIEQNLAEKRTVLDRRKISDMPISSSTRLKYIYHNCGCMGLVVVTRVGEVPKACGKRGGWYSVWDWCGGKFAFFHSILSDAVDIFLLCRLKINYVTEIENMHLFLGPLAYIVANKDGCISKTYANIIGQIMGSCTELS